MIRQKTSGGRDRYDDHAESPFLLAAAMLMFLVLGSFYVGTHSFHVRQHQMIEFLIYAVCLLLAVGVMAWNCLTLRRRRERNWPHPPLYVSQRKDRAAVRKGIKSNSIILGYDVHGSPWYWSDAIRTMQTVVFGATGAGKTTLLKNIITQDLVRVLPSSGGPRRIPMIIFDGKGDQTFLDDLLPAIEASGRMHQLRILNPSRPDISVRYNPFFAADGGYQEHANLVFQSFDLRRDFFYGHQSAYLNDLVRILAHTGKRFNVYDILVLALDLQVMREQIKQARQRLATVGGITSQQRLNFEMSARNLQQSFDDRDRVPKIQGLLNELMTFVEDDLSVVTGAYDELFTLDDLIDQDLILAVSLNTNKNSKSVTALGRMLLQNLQLVIGKRYENQELRNREDRPLLSVILDEFAPFAYSNFAQILNTARGTNTAFLFALQSLPQLLSVSEGFRDDVSSAPNTNIVLRTKDEETVRYFRNASSEVRTKRRTLSVERIGILEEKYEQLGTGTETEIRETRSQDDHIKNLPMGQMEILMTDQRFGTLHSHLHVRMPESYRFPGFNYRVYPRLYSAKSQQNGANLRFMEAELARRNPRLAGRGSRLPWQ